MQLHTDRDNVFTVSGDTIIYTRVVHAQYYTIRLTLKEGEAYSSMLRKMENLLSLDDDTICSFAKLQKESETI